MHFKILLAVNEAADVEFLSQRFHAFGCTVLGNCAHGPDILQAVQRYHPNVLFMNPFLPGMNCDEVTELLEMEYSLPLVKIVYSGHPNDAMVARFYGQGGDVFLLAPLDISKTLNRMERFLYIRTKDSQPRSEQAGIRSLVRNKLVDLEIPISSKGFYYLKDTICLAVEQPRLLQQVVSGLYTTVAQKYNTSPANIERCIRSAVEQTFDRGDLRRLGPIFGSFIRPNSGKPTNGDFISVLVNMIRQDLHYD